MKPSTITGADMVAWRGRLNIGQTVAGDLLGMSRRIIQAYEAGEMHGRPYPIPKVVQLAMEAVEAARAGQIAEINGTPELCEARTEILQRLTRVLYRAKPEQLDRIKDRIGVIEAIIP